MMTTMNYLLIDFESVQPETVAALGKGQYNVLVFVGANQAKVPFPLASALQSLGDKAEYIKISGHGPNALDFHIAYYIGQFVAKHGTAKFHIVSRDTGFDPLIDHLKSKGIWCRRVKDLGELAGKQALPDKPSGDRLAVVTTRLRHPTATKPRTVKTLSNLIACLFQRKIAADEVAGLIQQLATLGVIAINEDKITYPPVPDGAVKQN